MKQSSLKNQLLRWQRNLLPFMEPEGSLLCHHHTPPPNYVLIDEIISDLAFNLCLVILEF
jgi:hypothetical protein